MENNINTSQNPQLTSRTLTRTDGPLSGVSAGLADYFNIDVMLVRIALLAGTIVTFPVVPVAYIAAWLIIPKAVQPPPPVAPIPGPNAASQSGPVNPAHPDAPTPYAAPDESLEPTA